MRDAARGFGAIPIVFAVGSHHTPAGDTVPIVITVVVVETLAGLTIPKFAPLIGGTVIVVDTRGIQIAGAVHAVGTVGTIVITSAPGDFLTLIGDASPPVGAVPITVALRIIVARTREGVAVLTRRTIVIVSAFRIYVTSSIQARGVRSAVSVDAAFRLILNALAIEAVVPSWTVYCGPTIGFVGITLSIPVAVMSIRAIPVFPALPIVPTTDTIVVAEHPIGAVPVVPTVAHTEPANTVVFTRHIRWAIPVVPALSLTPATDANVFIADHLGWTIPIVPTRAVAHTTEPIVVAEHFGRAVPIFPAVPLAPTTDTRCFIAVHVGWTIPIFPAISPPQLTDTVGIAEHFRRAVPIASALVGSGHAMAIFTDFIARALLVESAFVFGILT